MIKCIGCMIYDKEKKMFLLQQRAKTTSHPMKWGFWGGKLKRGEDFGQGLLRELKEELNIEIDFEKIYPLDVFLGKDNNFIYYSFVIVVNGLKDFTIHESETNDFLWITLEYLDRIDLHPGSEKTIREKKHILREIVEKNDED